MPDLTIYLCAGEPSGDRLGAQLMAEIRKQTTVQFEGVGGPSMMEQGLQPLFDMAHLSVMGVTEIIGKLPKLFALIDQTAKDIVAKNPDCVVYIDAQDFTKRVARKVRLAAPHIKQILYVAPTVWAWRPGRAKYLEKYIDHILAILPFEPDVMTRLGGPSTTYVGHPLLATMSDQDCRECGGNNLVFLPGSRNGDLTRHLQIFEDVAEALAQNNQGWKITLPTIPRLKDRLRTETESWKIKPKIVAGEAAMAQTLQAADAALAVSGTITLELACAQIPQIVVYKTDKLMTMLLPIVDHRRISLPNLILTKDAIPEYLNKNIAPENITEELIALASNTAARKNQLAAYQEITNKMQLGENRGESSTAAKTVLSLLHSLPT